MYHSLRVCFLVFEALILQYTDNASSIQKIIEISKTYVL